MKLTMVLPTMDAKRCGAALDNWRETTETQRHVVVVGQGLSFTPNPEYASQLQFDSHDGCIGMVAALQRGYELVPPDTDVVGYLHDDVTISEQGWDTRVLSIFERDPRVGVVGFGGATVHGHPDLYRTPYRLTNLARYGYVSNTDDAEMHGERFEGTREVAVIDGFAMFVRKRLLDRWGGWPARHIRFHCYDYALAAECHRQRMKVMMTGVRCFHSGGKTSTTKTYQDWLATQGTSDQQTHEQAHAWFFNEYRDVMPWSVKEVR